MRDRLMRLHELDQASGCWLWTGHVSRSGYGRITVGGKDGTVAYAHRISYEHFKGTIPPELNVMHSCDVRRCINPDHLSLGTPIDNMADRDAKGRGRIPRLKGAACPWAKLSEADVKTIRARVSAGERQRILASEYGVTQSQISMIKARQRWA